jgi:predicted ATPase
MPAITKLELENFQSIKDRAQIEFGPITLLFGPNSAGKSTVFDALAVIENILRSTPDSMEAAHNMIRRWAHRVNQAEVPNEIFMSLALETEFSIDLGDDLGVIFGAIGSWSPGIVTYNRQKDRGELAEIPAWVQQLENVTLRVEITGGVQFGGTNERGDAHLDSLKILIGGEEVMSTFSTGYGGVDGSGSNNIKIANLSTLFHGAFADGAWDHPSFATEYVADNVYFPEDDMSSRPHHYISHISRHDKELSDEGMHQWVSLFRFFSACILYRLEGSIPLVSADRGIPGPADLSQFVELEDSNNGGRGSSLFQATARSGDQSHFVKFENSNYGERGSPHFQALACAAHAATLVEAHQKADSSSASIPRFDPEDTFLKEMLLKEAERFHQINKYLDEYLFIEKFYRVVGRSKLVIDMKSLEENLSTIGVNAHVDLSLVDADGNQLEFIDVGSGISYVLPWLTAITYPGLISIQQPELHLHPALQSKVADILISALSDGNKQLIVETHSEHLILRLLRRIRESVDLDSPVLTNEDLEVYYFEPSINEGSHVSRQAVTPSGDFYLDWPRGFFTERDEDLFIGG